MFRFLLFIILLSSSLFASVGKISAIIGDASVNRENSIMVATLGMELKQKDIIQTKANAKLQIIFNDQTIVTIGKNSALNIQEYLFDMKTPENSKAKLNFFKGAFKTVTGTIGKLNKKKFILKTKSSTIGIRGTIILGNQRVIACTQGAIRVEAGGKVVDLDANQLTVIQENQQPSPPKNMSSGDISSLEDELEPEQQAEKQNKEAEQGQTQAQNPTGTQKEKEEEQGEGSQNTQSSETDEQVQNGLNTEENENNPPPPPSDETPPPPSGTTLGTQNDTSDITGNTGNEPIAPITPPLAPAENLAQETTESANDDQTGDEVTTSYTVDFQGYLLGGYYLSGSQNFYQNDNSFKAKRVDSVFSFAETISRYNLPAGSNSNISTTQSKELSSFTKPAIGAYTGHSHVGSLPYSYTYNGTTISGNYTIEADNTGEFFVGSTNTSVFKELFVVGKKTDKTKINQNKIYFYKSFKILDVFYDSNGLVDEHVKLTSGDGVEFYNARLKSFTHVNSDSVFEKGAENFIAGYNDSVIAYINEYNYDDSSGSEVLKNLTSDLTGSAIAMGTNAQGLAIDISGSEDFSSGTNRSMSMTGASFLDKTFNDYGTQSNDINMSGFSVFYEDNITTNDHGINNTRDSSINLSLNQSTGTISADLNYSTLNMDFSGNISSKSSYYINDDLFGVLATSSSNYNGYNVVDKTGYLIAVPDMGFDINDNPIFRDDDSSWGYWTARFDIDIFVDPKSVWVAGVEIPNVFSIATGTHDFEGKVMGSVMDSNDVLDPILMNGQNSVNIQFDFGGGTSALQQFDVAFKTKSNKSWNLSLDTGSVTTSTGFSGDFLGSSTGGGETLTDGSFEGKFYGKDALKSVGGKFNAITSSYEANGVFKATRK